MAVLQEVLAANKTREVCGKRRVGTPGACDRGEGDATNQSDQYHDRQKARQSATGVGPIAEPSDSEGVVHCSDDLHRSPLECCVSLLEMKR